MGRLHCRAPSKVSVAQDEEGEVVDGVCLWILQWYCAEENFKNFSFPLCCSGVLNHSDLINIFYDLII